MENKEVGKGTYGSVTTRTQSQLITAVKKIKLDGADSHDVVLNQDTILSMCDHPHIVKYHSGVYVEKEQTFYLEMEHLSGGDLQSFKLNRNYSMLQLCLRQITSALLYLHQRNIIHRDIKLSNLMINSQGTFKIIDFGISIWKWMLPHSNNPFIGSPCYMAPEVILKQHYDQKIDIYSLGVCIYQLIYGQSPYPGQNKNQYWKNTLTKEIMFGRDCPQRWETLMKKMLKKNPRKRFSAFEILAYLDITSQSQGAIHDQ